MITEFRSSSLASQARAIIKNLTLSCEKQHKDIWTVEVSLEEIDLCLRTLNLQLQAIHS